jgi:hypothetical protein
MLEVDTPMTRLLCYIGFHRYRTMYNDQGQHYLECTRCKKYKDDRLAPGDVTRTNQRAAGVPDMERPCIVSAYQGVRHRTS